MIDLSNQVFGNLTAIEYNIKTKKWICLCQCGNTSEVEQYDLRRKDSRAIKNCKNCRSRLSALRAIERTGYSGPVNKLYYIYGREARLRNILFDISIEDFYNLTQMNCHYCGVIPSQIINQGRNREQFIEFYYNGIDRVNNNLGYTKDNCVTSCKKCNFAKGTMTYDDFISWINALVSYRGAKLDG